MDLATITPERRLRLSLHPGQARAWVSKKRFVVILAGTQSGKTSFGPHWLLREIGLCGPGDYMVIAPTFQLLEKKALPEFRRLFERTFDLGRYQTTPSRKFVFSETGERRVFGETYPETPTIVWFGYAEDPESLESATAKAAWCDEAGQKKFRVGSWEAIRRRVAIHRGRILITTTPYDLGWIKQVLHDPWRAANGNHPDIDLIRFDSTENPAFPRAEFEQARRELPRWKFDLFYRGILSRPAGLIYDAFIDEMAPHGHKLPRSAVPAHWPRFLGLDFGGVNTAGVFYARDPATQRLLLYRTYHAGNRTAKEHVAALLAGEPTIPLCVGGSHSEDQWRQEFAAAGLGVLEPPIKDVEVGINRVYAAHRCGEILVCSDLVDYLEEKTTYSRELDEQGEATEKIEDKSRFHLLDAERYLIAHLRGGVEMRTAGSEAPALVQQYGSQVGPYLGGR